MLLFVVIKRVVYVISCLCETLSNYLHFIIKKECHCEESESEAFLLYEMNNPELMCLCEEVRRSNLSNFTESLSLH